MHKQIRNTIRKIIEESLLSETVRFDSWRPRSLGSVWDKFYEIQPGETLYWERPQKISDKKTNEDTLFYYSFFGADEQQLIRKLEASRNNPILLSSPKDGWAPEVSYVVWKGFVVGEDIKATKKGTALLVRLGGAQDKNELALIFRSDQV